MESKELEDLCNTTEAEDETIANQKKRLRRVSFADNITSVHVFDRDEDLETPPDAKSSSENSNAESAAENEPPGFRGDSADSDDSKESMRHEDEDDDDEEEEEEEGRELFVRNMEFSSSPRSAAGSVTSNEEDNFFGPVSTSFIRSGRLSTESANSDNNHDITMDSTAFSLHFRNLMQSDERTSNSRHNFKSPTGVHLMFGDKTTSGDSMLTKGGDLMVLTGIKKPITHNLSGGRSNGGRDSNDMSLIVENPHKYDYGKLSPSLDALLAEGQHISVSNQVNISNSSKASSENRFSAFCERTNDLMDRKCSDSAKVQTAKGEPIPAELLSDVIRKPSDADDSHVIITTGCISSYHCSSSVKETPPADTADRLRNETYNEPIQGMFSRMDEESLKDAPEVSQHQIELGFANSGHTLTPLNKTSLKNSIIQHDYGSTGHIRDRTGEKHHFSHSSPIPVATSPMLVVSDGRQRLAESPGSITSLRAKRQRLYLDTPVPVSRDRISTPFAAEQHRLFLNKEATEYDGASILSIKSKISKFNICETCEVGVDNSKPSLSGLANKPSLYEDVLVKNNYNPKLMPVGCSVTDIKEHLLANGEENAELEIEVEMHDSRVETPKNFNTSRLSGKSPHIFHDGGHGSGKRMDDNPMMFNNPIRGDVRTPTQYHSQIHKTAELMNIKQVTGTPSKFISSPVKRLEQKFSLYGGPAALPSWALNHQNHSDKPVGSSPGRHIEDSLRTAPSASQVVTSGAEDTIESSSLLKGNREHSTLPLFTHHHGKCEETASQESFLLDLQKELKSTVSYQTPMSNRVTLNFHSGSQDKNVKRMDHTKFSEKFSPEKFRASSYESVSPDVSKRTGPRTLSERLMVQVVQNTSRKKTYNLTENDNMFPLSRKLPVSPTLLQGLRGFDSSDGQLSLSLQPSLFVPDIDSSGRKTSDGISLMEKVLSDDIDGSRKSGKLGVGEEGTFIGFCSENHVAGSTEADMIMGEPLQKNWSNVFLKFSAAAEQLLPTSTDKLNLRELGKLEDMLGQLQRLKKYEKICTEIQSQKMHQHLGTIQQRVVEARWLQHMLVFERLKLQLLHLKRDRLLRNVQQLQSGIQDCHNFKINILQSHPGKIDAQNEDRCVQSDSIECDAENQDSHHTVIRMRKELRVLDQKVKKIIKFFQASCKIKGDWNFDEAVALINDHLQKQEHCRLIRQYLLLWELDDIERRADQCNIVLNYRGLLSQRLAKTNGPVSSIVFSNLLSVANINMSFPNMNACIAFEFVFNDKSNSGLGYLKSFQQGTQLTSFLLGNLLDVVGEVQAAQMELPNLVKASFHSSCAVQLELQLCFIDFKIGRKVILMLDMTELNCGIYPSKIAPSQLKIQIPGTQAVAALLSAEILDAVRSFTAGQHSMITRLCHCVSQVVLSSSR